MSYSHSVEVMNAGRPVRLHRFKCDITGEEIREEWPHYHIPEKDVHISMTAIQQVLAPAFLKSAPVPIEMALADLKWRVCPGKRRKYIPKRLREEVLASNGGNCAHCGKKGNLEVDHIRPVKHGGTNDRANLQPLCKRCNSSKGAKLHVS